MKDMLVYPIGSTPACTYAASFLEGAGISLVDHPAPEVTHLLLDIPSFGADGMLRCGGDLEEILRMLPPDITIVGGNLDHPILEGHQILDLLKSERYLAQNAAITAHCALSVAAQNMTAVFSDSPALVIGWGRIGKCLGQLLKAIGSDVTIAARKESDQAMIRALGLRAVDICQISRVLPKCRLVFNTVPELVLSKDMTQQKDCLFVDLASKKGMEGDRVIWARGLPGVHAPESSGKLIAETFLKLSRRDLG